MELNRAVIDTLEKGGIVLTPTRRLSEDLLVHFSRHALNGQSTDAIAKPQVYALQDWIAEIWQLFFLNEQTDIHLLSAQSSLMLFEKIIKESEYASTLLRTHSTAKLILSAWGMLNQWQQTDKLQTDFIEFDHLAFKAFCETYQMELDNRNAIDSYQVISHIIQLLTQEPDFLSEHYQTTKVVCYGFDDFPPNVQKLFEVLVDIGWQVREEQPNFIEPSVVEKYDFDTIQDEIAHAAVWARALHEKNPNKKIAVVLPDLPQHRERIAEIFQSTFSPFYFMKGEDSIQPKFNISTAIPLNQYPIVKTAVMLLSLFNFQLRKTDCLELLSSPFIIGGISQHNLLQKIVSLVRAYPAEHIALSIVQKMFFHTFGPEHELTNRIQKMNALKQQAFNQTNAFDFKNVIEALLETFNWPGERPLNSLEHQTVNRFYQAINEFSRYQYELGFSDFADCLDQFRKSISNIAFQAENKGAPIQILGALEASGLTFDALWLMNLYQDNWPAKAEPNPFIPVSLQRQFAMPHSCAKRELEFAKRLTTKFLKSAEHIICSFPRTVEKAQVYESELISAVPQAQNKLLDIETDESVNPSEKVLLECLNDAQVPMPVTTDRVKGGSQFIVDQANCAFKAFAKHRLKADKPQSLTLGLNPMQRGIIVHDILQRFWTTVKDQDTLKALGVKADSHLQEVITEVITFHKRQIPLSEVFWAIENVRLFDVMKAVMEFELQRAPFKVIAIEQELSINIKQFRFRLRIDRVDQLQDNVLLIDYKTATKNINDILYTPLRDPQLPLYLQGKHDFVPNAIAWFTIGKEQPTLVGVSENDAVNIDKIVPVANTKLSLDWQALSAQWSENIVKIVEDIQDGRAEVNPLDGQQTCRLCDLQSLCRIYERGIEN